jgi:hypothetical protein
MSLCPVLPYPCHAFVSANSLYHLAKQRLILRSANRVLLAGRTVNGHQHPSLSVNPIRAAVGGKPRARRRQTDLRERGALEVAASTDDNLTPNVKRSARTDAQHEHSCSVNEEGADSAVYTTRTIPFLFGSMLLRPGQTLSIIETPEWQGPTVIVRKVLRHPGPDGEGKPRRT